MRSKTVKLKNYKTRIQELKQIIIKKQQQLENMQNSLYDIKIQ